MAVVLCASSAYEEKYYFNQEFAGLPRAVKEELQVMCMLYTADVHIFSLIFPLFFSYYITLDYLYPHPGTLYGSITQVLLIILSFQTKLKSSMVCRKTETRQKQE